MSPLDVVANAALYHIEPYRYVVVSTLRDHRASNWIILATPRLSATGEYSSSSSIFHLDLPLRPLFVKHTTSTILALDRVCLLQSVRRAAVTAGVPDQRLILASITTTDAEGRRGAESTALGGGGNGVLLSRHLDSFCFFLTGGIWDEGRAAVGTLRAGNAVVVVSENVVLCCVGAAKRL